MADEKILDKLKKILALTQSSNRAEAEAAMSMATELMTRHQLTIQQVEAFGKQPDKEYIEKWHSEGGKRASIELKFIWEIISKYFFVKIILAPGTKGAWGREASVSFIGTPENVEIAIYTYDFLKRTFLRLFHEYQRETGAPAKSKQSFYQGLRKGLSDKLALERKKVEDSMALVVVEDPDLEAAVKRFHAKTSHQKTRFSLADTHARLTGEERGKQINLNPGVKGGTTQALLR